MNGIKILAGQAGKPLASKVAQKLGLELTPATVGRFADGEVHIQILESVRNSDIFIINPTNPPAENFLEMALLAEAARGSSAGRITLVPSYLGYNRQDRKDRPRVPISAHTLARFLSQSGANRALLFDLHSEPTMGFFDPRVVIDHLYASIIAVPYLSRLLHNDFVVASPDKGGGPRASHYADHLGKDDYVVLTKERKRINEVDINSIKILGDVRDRDILFVDDMIDTGGTMIADAAAAKKAGAKKIYVFATHGLFSRKAIARLDKSEIDEIITTDSIYNAPDQLETERLKITLLSIAGLLAQAIRSIHQEESVSKLILKK